MEMCRDPTDHEVVRGQMSAKGLHLYVKQWLKLIVVLSPRDFHLGLA